jgi:hypothetical protein
MLSRDEDFAAFNLHCVGFEIDADGSTLGGARGVVKAAIVFRAFDDVVHHQAISQMHLLVGAQAIGGVVFIVG